MNWKSHGKEGAEWTTDAAFSVHPVMHGWEAWQRMPTMMRIGVDFPNKNMAKDACEGRLQQPEKVHGL